VTRHSQPVSKAAVFKTCIRTARWQPSEEAIAFYNKLAFTENNSIANKIAEMEALRIQSEQYGQTFDKTADEQANRDTTNMAMYFTRFNEIICAAAELSIQPRKVVETTPLPGKLENMQHILNKCSQLSNILTEKDETSDIKEAIQGRINEIDKLLDTLNVVCGFEKPRFRTLRRRLSEGWYNATTKEAISIWAYQVEDFIGSILVSKGIEVLNGKICYPPEGNQNHPKMSTNELFGNMSSQGSGGPFDGIVHDGTFESDLEKLADIVKETQQELNVSFWSTSVMRATLTVADSQP
jgi:hypothetical protein